MDYGSANISPIYGAFAIATKGHFFETNKAIKTPEIYGKHGDLIVPGWERDDTYVGVEKFSGINLHSNFRTQINLIANSSSSLFDNLEHDFVFPLYFNQKDLRMTDNQVGNVLHKILTQCKLRFPVMIGLIVCTAIFTICSLCCCKKYTLEQPGP